MFSRHKSKNNKNLVAPTKATRDLASRVVREASWFSLLFIGLYITLALISYSGIDPSFSHSIDASKNINNLAGISGAYFSDFFLNIFGLSAWWLVFLSVYSIFLIYPRIENE
ncbi:DNA translocase FtsK 4TM domain-containing protein, partial [Methylophilaceae bacterium]|nr:DNA translocase FtsK 4TM domain-containing protein [Methylophilaceae bacterium]